MLAFTLEFEAFNQAIWIWGKMADEISVMLLLVNLLIDLSPVYLWNQSFQTWFDNIAHRQGTYWTEAEWNLKIWQYFRTCNKISSHTARKYSKTKKLLCFNLWKFDVVPVEFHVAGDIKVKATGVSEYHLASVEKIMKLKVTIDYHLIVLSL